MDYLKRELWNTREELNAIRTVAKEHHDENVELKKELQEMRKEFDECVIRNNQLDPQIRQCLKTIDQLYDAIEKNGPDQLKIYYDIFRKWSDGFNSK